MPFINILLLAVLIEAVVSAIKPLWSKKDEKMSVAEIVSMGLGVVLCVSCHIDMLEYLVPYELVKEPPIWVPYIFYTLTGIAIGRGPSFLWDLWQQIRKVAQNAGALSAAAAPIELDQTGLVNLNIATWSLEQLKSFCELNDVPTDGCLTREDYMDAIENAGRSDKPPDSDTGKAE